MNKIVYESVENHPPENMDQVEIHGLLPIDFYEHHIRILEQIQNEYLSEKTLWQKIKKINIYYSTKSEIKEIKKQI